MFKGSIGYIERKVLLLLLGNCGRFQRYWQFHRGEAQYLEQMIYNYVTVGDGVFVESGARLRPGYL